VHLLARRCLTSEIDIAEGAYKLALQRLADGASRTLYESHIGFYLCDEGRALLCGMFDPTAWAPAQTIDVQRRRTVLWCFSMQFGTAIGLAAMYMIILPRLMNSRLMSVVEYLLLLNVMLQVTRGLAVAIASRFSLPCQLPALRLDPEDKL